MINNSNFLLTEIPKFHAISQQYDRTAFWKEQKRRMIEGYWSGGKWMPGTLYYYCNFHTIRFEEEGAASRRIGRPWLRDIEWEKAYVYEEAMGFSGFSNDNIYTCDRKYGPEKDRALKFGWITQEQLNTKTYIPARDYLRKIHPVDLGNALYNNQAKNVLDLEARGCLAKGTKLLMFDGSNKNIEDIIIGDQLMGKDGTIRTVLDTHNGVSQMYSIKHTKDNSFDELIVNENHQVSIRKRLHFNGQYSGKKRFKGWYETIFTNCPISELFEKQSLNSFENQYYRYKPEVPLLFKKKNNVTIDPYYLGLWLADGRSNCTSIKITDAFLWTYLKNFANDNNIKYSEKITEAENYDRHRKEAREYYFYDDNFRQKFKDYHLILNKHIPEDYLVSSEDIRLKLLAGIIDGDGTYDKKCKNFIIYVGLDEKLARQYLFLCRSLGFMATLNCRERGSYKKMFQIILNGDLSRIPTLLNRKKAPKINHRNAIFSSSIQIEKLNIGKYYGLVVDKDQEYLLSDFSVDHNSGKSYWAGSLILHNFLFDGAYNYDTYLQNKKEETPSTSDTVVGAIESRYVDVLLKMVKIGMEHLPDKQIINNEIYPSPLFVNSTGSLSSGKTLTSSIGSVINIRTFLDNPLSANGTRPNRAFLEEVGFLENIVEVWGALESTQASSDFKNLVIYGLGTGGLSTHGAVTYTKEIFYNPEEFNCLSFDDIWENKGRIGFFMPATHTINKFKKGENLITDEVNAKIYVEEEINKAKASGNRRRYMAEIINKPLKPSDIFLTVEGNFFPIDDIREHLASIENNKRILKASWKVEFYIKDGKVEWNVSNKPVLREFPHRRGDILDTAIEIWELPKTDSSGKPPYGRYLASLDPVDNDGGDDTEHSLLSGFILDSWTDRIVVEYSGRTKLVDEFYEQWRRCLVFYNAICNYERNLKGFYPHMKKNTSLHYLCDQPEILSEKGLATRNGAAVGNQIKGTHCTIPIINWGLELLLTYINNKAYEQGDIVQDENTDEAIYIRNLSTIRSPAVLQEMLAYNSEVNVDRISSLILLMILREDRIMLSKNAFNKKVEVVTTNKFWDKAYKRSPNHYFNPYGNKN
jgi:hypothetical protein